MNENKVSYVLTACLTFALLTLNACREAACPSDDLATQLISIEGHTLTVMIAATVAERACGLSQRPELAANHGMLFVYKGDRILEFWMKDTLIPLTIAYLNAEGRIMDTHDMEPRDSERRYRSNAPARYALETHRDWFRSNGIQVGDRVDFQLPPGLAID
jgi:uncharacterized membrane protein (UPF0127 family)